ncbi:MAG: DegT/DnrJ/EryC1/StrS family aminotransferase, partial [Bacteroidales bacterium]|nr:DegT/DnrJ/EryC1/StrS family aminotransferase [Bacteroidales bacterium]
ETVPVVGTNAKLSEMHAAMGLCNLRHVDEDISLRKIAYERYVLRLNNTHGIKLSPINMCVKANYAYMPVLFDGFKKSRDIIVSELAESNVFARKYFYPLTSDFSAYRNMFEIQSTPIAKHISENILCLPLYAGLTPEQVDYICNIILK